MSNDENMPSNNEVGNTEIDLFKLISFVWEEKFKIFGISVLIAIAFMAGSFLLTERYKSEAVIAPVSTAGDVSGLASRFGGIASLAGINLGGSDGTDRTQLAMQLILSRKFSQNLLADHELVPYLMAVDKWDSEVNEIVLDASEYDQVTGEWLVVDGENMEPSPGAVFEIYSDRLQINLNNETGFLTISFVHESPEFARDMIDLVISRVNAVVKRKDIQEAEESIQYLESQIVETQYNELKTGLFELIQSQTEKIMLAKSRPDYVFKVIDPAYLPEELHSPKRIVIFIVGGIFGFILAAGGLLIRARLMAPSADQKNA